MHFQRTLLCSYLRSGSLSGECTLPHWSVCHCAFSHVRLLRIYLTFFLINMLKFFCARHLDRSYPTVYHPNKRTRLSSIAFDLPGQRRRFFDKTPRKNSGRWLIASLVCVSLTASQRKMTETCRVRDTELVHPYLLKLRL